MSKPTTRHDERDHIRKTMVGVHPDVTDHAIVRYLQRVKGLDINVVVQDLLAEGRGLLAKKLGTCRIPMPGGIKIVVKKGVVVTVLTKDRDE